MTSWVGSEYYSSLGFLVDCLEQVPSLRDPGARRLCLELLTDQLGVTLVVEDLATPRTHLIGIVQACRRQHPRGLSALVEVLEQMEPNSLPVQRARAAVDDMITIDVVAEPDRRELLTLLGGSTGDRLAEFVRAAAGPAVEPVPPQHRPSDAIATLERMNARPDGLPPLLVFVEYLADYFGDHRSEQLRRWNDRQAARTGLTAPLAALRRGPATEPAPPRDVEACLVIRLEPDLLEPGSYTAVHWRQCDPDGWRPRRGEEFTGDLDAVRGHVADLVAEAEAGWATGASTIRIEFLLPYALLNLPVDQWDLEAGSALPRPVGLHYQVVVRSLDRARAPRWHREWRRRWELLKQVPHGVTKPEDHWLWSEGGKPKQLTALDATLAVRKEVVSLVLRSVPEGPEPGEVMVGVRTGVPVMIWQRTESARPAFEAEVKAMRDGLAELAEGLRVLRSRAKQGSRPDSHVGSRVSLLWDDPDRPVEPQDPPADPNEEVAAR